MMKTKGTVVVFGGTGFLGQYIVRELAQAGYPVKVASRHPNRALPLKSAGSPGQIVPIHVDILNENEIKEAVTNAYAVVSLVGILFENGTQNFTNLHAKAAENIAKIAKQAGIKKLIHISSLGVDKPTKAKYARTKITGEQSVLAAFPEAVILRPAVIFGAEDNFFNKFAKMAVISPFLPLIGGGKTLFQPVYVADVAKAVRVTLEQKECEGKIFELGGTSRYSFRELMELVLTYTHRRCALVEVPFAMANVIAGAFELSPFPPPLTRDQVTMLRVDNIIDGRVGTFKELKIQPTPLEAIVPYYLECYKRKIAS